MLRFEGILSSSGGTSLSVEILVLMLGLKLLQCFQCVKLTAQRVHVLGEVVPRLKHVFACKVIGLARC